MRVTFRAKLLGIVGVAALALLLLIVASAAIARQVERQLTSVQQRYLPRVQLELQLQGQLERMQRGFQDAVAAGDPDGLTAVAAQRDEFLGLVAAAGEAVEPADAAQLRAALGDYFPAADDVSRRLIAGETGEQLTDAIASMQVKQSRTAEAIKQATALTRDDLAAAFAAATQAERRAGSYRLGISLACLALVLLLSLALSRGLLRSVRALAEGFARFGAGEFGRPIPIVSGDEIGELARQANEMAQHLDVARQELRTANRELEAFSYSVAHDLRAPLRAINGFGQALLEDYGHVLDGEARGHLDRINAATTRMAELIDALLSLSRVARAELRRERVDLSAMVDSIVKQLRASQPDRVVEVVNPDGIIATGDGPLLRAVLENLLGNAWKFTGTSAAACISFGVSKTDGDPVYYVRDNGAGFDMAYASKLFAPFQRLHSEAEFAGTGVGLATVQRIVQRHGGRIWAESAVGHGATFQFTLASSSQGASQ